MSNISIRKGPDSYPFVTSVLCKGKHIVSFDLTPYQELIEISVMADMEGISAEVTISVTQEDLKELVKDFV